jgi:hypothetical protein
MARSKDRQGIRTIFDPETKHLKQFTLWGSYMERFSRGSYPDEDSAWEADDLQRVVWPPIVWPDDRS